MARITRPAIVSVSHASKGIFPRLIPLHRMQRMVAMMLIAVPTLPKPETSRARIQKSVLCPCENVFEVSGA